MPPLRTIKLVQAPPPQSAVTTTSSNAEKSEVTKEKSMSLFSAFDKDAKSIASKVEAAFKKLFQEEPKVEQVAVSVISAVAPIVVAIAAVSGSEPEAAAITGIVNIVKSDLAAIQVTLNEAGAGTANVSVKSTFQAINDNLAILLSAGYIKNPQTLATVTADVNKIETGLNVLIAAL